jgi:DNA invertase Pin-like site-specific DNA recombinase
MATKSIPAAQYLRMSIEHQQDSLENRSLAIEKYAVPHGFEIVRTGNQRKARSDTEK